MSDLGIVVIGCNEGQRLRDCLVSVLDQGHRVVYVDSGSTDDSVTLARSLGADVVELDPASPFTAARGRNEGAKHLARVATPVRLVQFVDGDCEVIPGWLARGRAELEGRPDAAVVCGRLRERYPERSLYNRLADLEWNGPVGEIQACGGIALMRLGAFLEVGGFDPTLRAGEEPELCLRLRRADWKLLRLDAEMARHDIAITRFAQWWRRAVRFGHGSLDAAIRGGRSDAGLERQIRSTRIWTLGWLATLPLAGALGARLGGPGLASLMVGTLAIAPGLQAIRIAARARNQLPDTPTALAYGILIMISKWAELTGQLGYLRSRAYDHRSRGREAN